MPVLWQQRYQANCCSESDGKYWLNQVLDEYPGMDIGYLAEKAGFEPAVRFKAYTRFPGVHLKPLGHFSKFILN